MTYLVSITTKFPVQCVCGSPKVLSLHTIQSPRWYVRRIRSQFTLIQYMIYIHIKIYLLFKIRIVWRIQINYINVALTFTEISGKQYNHTFPSTVKYAMTLYFMKLLFCYIWRILPKLHFLFRKDWFRLFRILRPMKSFSSFKWKKSVAYVTWKHIC